VMLQAKLDLRKKVGGALRGPEAKVKKRGDQKKRERGNEGIENGTYKAESRRFASPEIQGEPFQTGKKGVMGRRFGKKRKEQALKKKKKKKNKK